MGWFLAHIVLSIVWSALLGSYDLLTLLSGFLVGQFLFRFTLREPTKLYRTRVVAVLKFILFYLGEILKSNLRIALDVVRGKPQIAPGIVAVNVEQLRPRATVLVANLITMTPGTLSLDISGDDKWIFVHCLYLDDPEAARSSMERDYVEAIAALQTQLPKTS
jgi:multicomponent Na+:H+ antiporter subunit E